MRQSYFVCNSFCLVWWLPREEMDSEWKLWFFYTILYIYIIHMHAHAHASLNGIRIGIAEPNVDLKIKMLTIVLSACFGKYMNSLPWHMRNFVNTYSDTHRVVCVGHLCARQDATQDDGARSGGVAYSSVFFTPIYPWPFFRNQKK